MSETAPRQIRHGSNIGQPLTRRDGVLKVTGGAAYAADHHPPGMLYAVMAVSRIARGRVTRLDVAAAESHPGVVAVMTPQNKPALAQHRRIRTAAGGGEIGADRAHAGMHGQALDGRGLDIGERGVHVVGAGRRQVDVVDGHAGLLRDSPQVEDALVRNHTVGAGVQGGERLAEPLGHIVRSKDRSRSKHCNHSSSNCCNRSWMPCAWHISHASSGPSAMCW